MQIVSMQSGRVQGCKSLGHNCESLQFKRGHTKHHSSSSELSIGGAWQVLKIHAIQGDPLIALSLHFLGPLGVSPTSQDEQRT